MKGKKRFSCDKTCGNLTHEGIASWPAQKRPWPTCVKQSFGGQWAAPGAQIQAQPNRELKLTGKSYGREGGGLQRTIGWQGAFWVAAGVPPLVLFSIGGIAGHGRQAALVVWILSMILGYVQAHTYAEMAGMFVKIRRRLGLRRHSLGALQPADRALVGLVQLVGLDPGAVDRVRAGGGLYPERLLRPRAATC